MIFFRPNTLNAQSSSSVSATMEVVRSLLDFFEPFIVFIQDELSFCDLITNSQPSVSDVVIGPKKLQSFPTQTKPFDNIINLWRLWKWTRVRLFCDHHIDIDIWMNEITVKGLFRIAFVAH